MADHILSVDIESYSEAPLPKCGLYRYMEDPSFEILLIGYALDDDPVTVLDLTSGDSTAEFEKLLYDPAVIKSAFNAAFERTGLAKHFGRECPAEQWQDTMILASYAGLPRSLKQVGEALRLGEGEAKLGIGETLIRYFSIPCKPSDANGHRTRNLPMHDRNKWHQYIEYNRRDVETERTIRKRLSKFAFPPQEQKLWVMDQAINDRGVMIDRTLAENAVRMATENQERLIEEAKLITHMDNPNSLSQLKEWLGVSSDAELRKKDVANLLATETDTVTRRMLEIRQELGKTSVKKYAKMLEAANSDDRVRGTTQFYKANRTGRWAGSIIQPQNFPRNELADLDLARELVKAGDEKTLVGKFGSLPDTLSQLIRTAIIPKPGCVFAVADFSAIEARVLAWLAGEEWRLEAFRGGKDIYCESASAMFHVPVVKHGINGELRQKGKVAELACGYSGGVGALKAMGALDMGIPEEELQGIIDRWREASPNIVSFWWNADAATKAAVRKRGTQQIIKGPVRIPALFRTDTAALAITLPSGRSLHYCRPKLGTNRFGGESITYEGNDAGHWGRLETYGGRFAENLTQAIARDCLALTMLRVTKMGYNIVFHVHDEMIVEVEKEKADQALADMLKAMSDPMPWAPDLPLKGDGYLCDYYKKD